MDARRAQPERARLGDHSEPAVEVSRKQHFRSLQGICRKLLCFFRVRLRRHSRHTVSVCRLHSGSCHTLQLGYYHSPHPCREEATDSCCLRGAASLQNSITFPFLLHDRGTELIDEESELTFLGLLILPAPTPSRSDVLSPWNSREKLLGFAISRTVYKNLP